MKWVLVIKIIIFLLKKISGLKIFFLILSINFLIGPALSTIRRLVVLLMPILFFGLIVILFFRNDVVFFIKKVTEIMLLVLIFQIF